MKPVYGPRSPQADTRRPGFSEASARIGPPPGPDVSAAHRVAVDRPTRPTLRRLRTRYRVIALGGGVCVLAVSVAGLWAVGTLAFG